ncbi:SEL1-like repeat protein [Paracoccus sp. XHP0099]|uniref:SEL1-like repeat protein n=2 Tax=Paracoccus marinaquae TaxID=2841926 RepID=A0ABS6ANH6_9RHOB|nr:caspase family protein [Paracoccus marinaquae]MBU3032044.1 SEL1-like repeat protein [Paracoccus marinaquae]
MCRLLHLCIAAGFLIFVSVWPAAAEEPRFALVVGNWDYGPENILKNPANDARAMASALLRSNFDVDLHENLDKAAFDQAIEAFLTDIPDSPVVLFYYAGHAYQRDGQNYLLPIGIDGWTAEEIDRKSLPVADLVKRFNARGAAFTVIILDACRNNPFVVGDDERQRGLASMESTGGETLIGFATQAGEVAYDGAGPNSPYTGALVNEIDRDGKDILDVFRSVRRTVRIGTGGLQRPFISASIERRFVFRDDGTGVPDMPGETEITADNLTSRIEAIWWRAIADSQVPEELLQFAAYFPASPAGHEARSLAQNLEQSGQVVRGLTLTQFNLPETRRAAEGLSGVVTNCDIVAGDPDDPRRVTDGVAWGLVNVRRGLQDCSAALIDDPLNPRLLHQMGRLLDIQNRYAEAEGFYRMAAAGDYSAAQVNLGFMYVTGKGRDRDYAQAFRYYKQAAALGNLRARTNIGEMFERGWHVEQNIDEAVLWYRLAAQNGWPNALDTLANMYRRGRDDQGRGVDRDPQEAARLYRLATELGNSNAMNNLGMLYLGDELGAPDVPRGIELLQRAADLGNRFAPFQLGRLYLNGEVVGRDEAKALRFLMRSADLGFSPAYVAIGRMYQSGQGVTKSDAEAAFYFTLGRLTADPKRRSQEQDARDRLEALQLDESRTSTALRRAEDWLRLNGE